MAPKASAVFAMLVSSCLFAGESASDLAVMPQQVLREGTSRELDVFSLSGPAVYTFTDAEGMNKLVCEVYPEGYVRLVRVFGAVECVVPVRQERIEFAVTTSQRVGIWVVSRLEVKVTKGRLVLLMQPLSWAVAVQVEFGGLTGVVVHYDGRRGVLFTGQRMDTVLAPDGKVELARFGKGAEAEAPKAAKGTSEGEKDLSQPGAHKPPKGWYRQPKWTDLPLLPGVVEPVPPEPVTP